MEVVQGACGALHNLASAADNAASLLRDGAHVAVMAAARAHVGNGRVLKDVCGALWCLWQATDCWETFVRDGVGSFLVHIITASPWTPCGAAGAA